MEDLKIKKISISGWRQFRSVELDIHDRLTVITGANGAGKSTILNIFAQHFGWQRQYLATPRKKSGDNSYSYFSGLYTRQKSSANSSSLRSNQPMGSLEYSNGDVVILQSPNETGVQYFLQIQNQKDIHGLHIPSHRALPFYQQVSNIPTNALSAEQAYNTLHSETVQRFSGGQPSYGSTYRLKESLISMATFGAGNAYVQGNKGALDAYVGFEEVLRRVLPSTLGFEKLSIRTPDVVLETKSGDFLIDASSGGIMALVDLAWQIHLFSLKVNQSGSNSFVVTIDEPENHLHPSMLSLPA